jgi:hypothetical protein
VIAWLSTVPVRLKLYALAGVTIFSALGYLWLRWKLASRRAATAEEKAEKLEQMRKLEQRIAASRAKTRAQQEAIKIAIRNRSKERDYFER